MPMWVCNLALRLKPFPLKVLSAAAVYVENRKKKAHMGPIGTHVTLVCKYGKNVVCALFHAHTPTDGRQHVYQMKGHYVPQSHTTRMISEAVGLLLFMVSGGDRAVGERQRIPIGRSKTH